MKGEVTGSTLAPALRDLERVAAKGTLQEVVLARATRALSRAVAEADSRSLGEAAAASTDLEVVLRWLVQPEAVRALIGGEPALRAARLRGLSVRAKLIEASEGLLTSSEVASLLGLSRQGVDKRRREGRLLALSLGRRGYFYPQVQFEDDKVVDGLEPTLAGIDLQDPWMKLDFLLGENVRLDGETPLCRLRRGDISTVLGAAAAYGEQVAD
jgi:hypothetical protein